MYVPWWTILPLVGWSLTPQGHISQLVFWRAQSYHHVWVVYVDMLVLVTSISVAVQGNLSLTFLVIDGLFMRVVLFYRYTVYLWELSYSIITWFICESSAILSLQGVFVRVVLLYHYMVYFWELWYSIITWFICESCAILSLQGVFMRVVLLYHYMVYLWELCFSIITWFILESCAILSWQVFFVRAVLLQINIFLIIRKRNE